MSFMSAQFIGIVYILTKGLFTVSIFHLVVTVAVPITHSMALMQFYIMNTNLSLYKSLSVPPNPVTVTITTSGFATAGQEYTLQCEVSAIPGLANTPIATWLHHNGSPVSSGGSITITPYTPSSSSALTFTTLTTFHAGVYTCEGRVESTALYSPRAVRETQIITVQSKLLYYI